MANKPSSIALRKIREELDKYLDESLKRTVQVVLPANLSKSFLLQHTPLGIPEAKWLSFTYYLAHTILLMSRERRFKKKKGAGKGWVPLPSNILQGIGGNSYKVLIDQLVNIGVIERDGKYSTVGHTSIGYKLGSPYRSQGFKYRTLPDEKVREGIVAHRKNRLEQMRPRLRELAHLTRWIIDGKLKITQELALDYIDFQSSIYGIRLTKLGLEGTALEDAESFTKHRRNWAIYDVEHWGKNTSLSVDDKGGRLYSPISTLLSPLRHFLTYDDKPLVSLDLKNSQPLHLTLLMRPSFWKPSGRNKFTLRNLDETLWKHVNEQVNLDKLTTLSSIMLSNPVQNTESMGVTNPHFAQLVFEGKLYEFISEQFRGKYFTQKGVDRFDTRSKAKKEVLRLMYFNPQETHSPSHDTFREFTLLFPAEAHVIALLKSRDYTDLPVLLQKLEAQILLHHVCKQVYELDSSIPLFTVHDSIITTIEHQETVKGIILGIYKKLLGATPQLEQKELHPNRADSELAAYVTDKLKEQYTLPEPTRDHKAVQSLEDVRRKLREKSVKESFYDVLPHPPFVLPGNDQEDVNPFAPPKRKLRK
jgi:hypothetical protein